mgnify:CR=1 FL=1
MKKDYWMILTLLSAVTLGGCADPSENSVEEPATSDSSVAVTAANDPAVPDTVPLPPIAEKRPHTVSAPGGDRVDPYYWMRDDTREDPEVIAWLEGENEYIEARLAHTETLQDTLVDELRGRIKEDDSSVPFESNGYFYYTRYEAGSEYPIYARRQGSMDGEEQIMLNVAEMAEGKDFFQIGNWAVSENGRHLAWLQDEVGRRQFKLMFKDLDTGEVIDTGLTGISSITWAADNQTLFYVANDPETLRSRFVRQYILGAENTAENLYDEDDASFYTGVSKTASGRFNFIYVGSTVSSEMRIFDSQNPELGFQVLFPRERDHEYIADHANGRWVIRSNWEAPNFRLMQAAEDQINDRDQWSDLIAHSEDNFIHNFNLFNEFVAVSERSDGLRRLRVLNFATGDSELIEFDEAAYAAYLSTNENPASQRLRYAYTSMTTPTSIFEIDVVNGDRELLKQQEIPSGFDSADYQTDRLWIEVRDGTMVPVSILHHVDTPLDGTAPLYQYAYGSYGSSSEPTFSTNRLSLVDRGFVFAIAHIRGGQEMGRTWYDQGKLLNKINTFSDFIDVTSGLVDRNLVDPDRVFAMGGSAGGLLMGAVANMAPDHYAGIIAHVPFVDVVTTMLDESIPLTTNEFDEWGNPMKPEFYDYMLSYSPYDNVSAQAYPAMLVTTGLWDSQVQYWEPAKWVARLRELKTDRNPLLLYTDMEAGHGGSSGRFERLERVAMEYAFVLDQAGMIGAD